MNIYERKIEVQWADCDLNRHVRHSAFYDYGAHVRIRFFAEIGFDSIEMEKLDIGPIIFKEECSFIKELHLEDTITINIRKGDVSPDGSRWTLHHEIFNTKNEKCAQLTLHGAWMNLTKRKLTTPPKEIAELFHALNMGSPYTYKSKSKNK